MIFLQCTPGIRIPYSRFYLQCGILRVDLPSCFCLSGQRRGGRGDSSRCYPQHRRHVSSTVNPRSWLYFKLGADHHLPGTAEFLHCQCHTVNHNLFSEKQTKSQNMHVTCTIIFSILASDFHSTISYFTQALNKVSSSPAPGGGPLYSMFYIY